MSFDVVVRGLVEKMIDQQLSKQNLALMHKMFEALRPAVKNREDAIFGYIVGWTGASITQIISIILKRSPTQEENEEIVKALHTRIFEIKSRIHETFT